MDRYKALKRDLGRRLAEVRLARGLTQEQFAEHLGVQWRYYQSVERGAAAISLRQLLRIADALELTMQELFIPPQSREVKPGRPRQKGRPTPT